MDFKIPVISVVGNKNSGKTCVMELLVKTFTHSGFRIATAKHISQKNFSIDRKDTDTGRHYSAGAKMVIGFSNSETFIINKVVGNEFSFDILQESIKGVDLLLLEGFSKYVAKEPSFGKIACVNNLEEMEKFRKKISGNILAYCSLNTISDGRIIVIGKDSKKLVKIAEDFIKEHTRI